MGLTTVKDVAVLNDCFHELHCFMHYTESMGKSITMKQSDREAVREIVIRGRRGRGKRGGGREKVM